LLPSASPGPALLRLAALLRPLWWPTLLRLGLMRQSLLTPALAQVFVLLLMALSALGAATAKADVSDSVNWARMRGCGTSATSGINGNGGSRSPLYSSAKLQQAAKRLSTGASLQSAMASAGYLAAQSTELHLSGVVGDAELSRALTAHYCNTVTDPKLRDIGVERRGRDTWLVLAAPVAIPDVGDAGPMTRHILDLVNQARAAGRRCGSKYFPPVEPLTLNPSLTHAALAHSRDMAQHAEFDHRGHDGSTPQERIQRAGYGSYRIVGENIAAGAMTPAEVTQGWLASPPHCENIMDGRFSQIGIAFASNLNTSVGIYWTQDFAHPR
jgi:uncharacterized protein YkwD